MNFFQAGTADIVPDGNSSSSQAGETALLPPSWHQELGAAGEQAGQGPGLPGKAGMDTGSVGTAVTRGSFGTTWEQREEGGREGGRGGLAPKYLAWLRARHGTSGTQNPARFRAKENRQIESPEVQCLCRAAGQSPAGLLVSPALPELCSPPGVAELKAGAIPTAAGTGGTGGTTCLSVLTLSQQHHGPPALTTVTGTSCLSSSENKFTYMYYL